MTAASASKSSRPSLGLVEAKSVELCPEGLQLESGATLAGPITVAYETYGELNAARDNCIVLCHALSGGAHAAGFLPGAEKPGWWDTMVGPGKAFDTGKYFIVCSNVLGGCYGTTGPHSVNPATGRPYGLEFPIITVADMTVVQVRLLDFLGVDRALAVAGGSMGGMQALQWAVSHPDRVRSVIAIACTHRHSAQQIAFNEVARQAIMADPGWNGGDYYDGNGPHMGLAIARMVGHVTYLSDKGMESKFGRRLRGKDRFAFQFKPEFEVETYLTHQGSAFVERFDGNSLLYLTKALDYFDLSAAHNSLTRSFQGVSAAFLLITFSSDWLYPPYQLVEVAQAVRRAGGDTTYCEIKCDYGHDSFLVEKSVELQEPLVRSFLERAHGRP